MYYMRSVLKVFIRKNLIFHHQDGQSIDCQITSSMVDVPNKEIDGTNHSSSVAEQYFEAFIAVLDKIIQSSSL